MRKGGGGLVRRPRSKLDLLDAQDRLPVGFVPQGLGEHLLRLLHEKARLLGRGAVEVEVDALHAGFTRFAVH